MRSMGFKLNLYGYNEAKVHSKLGLVGPESGPLVPKWGSSGALKDHRGDIFRAIFLGRENYRKYKQNV